MLLDNGTLDPVPLDLARRLNNILEQGLGGTGAIRKGATWATSITGHLLREVQQDIANGIDLASAASTHHIALSRLVRYISESGELTALGHDVVDTAGSSSHVATIAPYSIMALPRSILANPLIGVARPIDQLPASLPLSLATAVQANQGVSKQFFIKDGIIESIDGTYYHYDIDLDVFIKDKVEESTFVYIVDESTRMITPLSIEMAQERASRIGLDQRSTVIKALGIDLDLTAIMNTAPFVASQQMEIPKRISYIWVGDQPLSPAILINLEKNRQIANEKRYQIHVYLSEKSKEKNYETLINVICDLADCNFNPLSKNTVKILEQTTFYKDFKTSINFEQYQAAIDGNGGIATNYAAAADILRLALLRRKGGLYMDVDDSLTRTFGDKILATDAHGFVLSSLLSSNKPVMDHQFGTSFFGVHPGNTVIDAMLQESHRRYQLPKYRNFFQTPRPSSADQTAMTTYANDLSFMTGPELFNAVLQKRIPATKQFREFSKLESICHKPLESDIIDEIAKHVPNAEQITPLADMHSVGHLHSWEQHR